MSYFLADVPLRGGELVTIHGEEAQHIMQSRRMIVGDTFHLQGPDEKRFHVRITKMGRSEIEVEAEHGVPTPPESPLRITLCQALTKEKALDAIIQKTTELGVHELCIFNTERTPERLPDTLQGKLERWQKIATEAAKQSDRVRGVNITWHPNFGDIVPATKSMPYRVVLAQGATEPLSSYLTRVKPSADAEIAIFVGSEGGWSGSEADMLSKATIRAVRMGPRVLRADTAAIAAVSVIQSMCGDMS